MPTDHWHDPGMWGVGQSDSCQVNLMNGRRRVSVRCNHVLLGNVLCSGKSLAISSANDHLCERAYRSQFNWLVTWIRGGPIRLPQGSIATVICIYWSHCCIETTRGSMGLICYVTLYHSSVLLLVTSHYSLLLLLPVRTKHVSFPRCEARSSL